MHLWITGPELPDALIAHAVLAGELELAKRGITLPQCIQAFAALARNDGPSPALAAFDAAQEAALAAIYGASHRNAGAELVLVVPPAPGNALPHAS